MNRTALLVAAALAVAAPAFAAKHDHGSHMATAEKKAGAASNAMADGEVKKVDKAAGKVTLKHGAYEPLDMPPMTMVFRVKDPAMLDKMKAGDKIRFKPEKVGGNYTVTEFEPAK